MALTKVDISLMENTTGFTIVTKIVTVASSKLVTDGVSQDTLTLTEGYTYKFDTSHATMSGHTFSFATAADAAGSTQYTTGVTTSGTPGSANAYTQIVVATAAPALYYYCVNHASMGGTASTPVAVIANKLLAYDGSGNLPVVDASQLTNVVTGITNSASDPTISTNPSGGIGTEWQNITSGEVYICTDATAGENVWKNVGAGSDSIAPKWYGGRGIEIGAQGSGSSAIDYITIATLGNGTTFGTLAVAGGEGTCVSNGSRGFAAGGYAGGYSNIIEYITIATPGNGTDFGDLYSGRTNTAGASNFTRAIIQGGGDGGPTNTIQYFTMATPGNSLNFGNATTSRQDSGTASSGTRAVFMGGNYTNVIDYVTIDTTGNSTDFGDLLGTWAVTRNGSGNETRGIISGGYRNGSNSNGQEYITIATTGNATDFGDLTVVRYNPGSTSDASRGVTMAGASSGGNTNIIDYITITTPGNSTDFGDLTWSNQSYGATSGA